MMVQELITNAIYKSLQDREHLPVVNSGYLLFGLYELNNILDEWRDKIPYNSTVTFNNVNNLQNSTFVEVITVNYIINTNSYILDQFDIVKFKSVQTVIGLLGFPTCYYFDQLSGNIQVYPLPSNESYQFTVWGKISQVNLGLIDTIPANMPAFMVKAITYELAFLLCAEYGIEWDSKKESIRVASVNSLMNKKSVDVTPDNDCVFGFPGSSNPPSFPYFYYLSGGGPR